MKLNKARDIPILVIALSLFGLIGVGVANGARLPFIGDVESHSIEAGKIYAWELGGQYICTALTSPDGSHVSDPVCKEVCWLEGCVTPDEVKGMDLTGPPPVPSGTPTSQPIFPTRKPVKATNTPPPTQRPGEPTHTPAPTAEPTRTRAPLLPTATNVPQPTATSVLFPSPQPTNTQVPTQVPTLVPQATATKIWPTWTAVPVPKVTKTAKPKCRGKVTVCHNGQTISVDCHAAIPFGPHGSDHGGVDCYMGPCK